jgi:hypothetical protein
MLRFIEVVKVITTRNDGFQKVQLDQNIHINKKGFSPLLQACNIVNI